MVFAGGPVQPYPSTRPVTEAESEQPDFEAVATQDDADWLELVANGAAGDVPDSVQQQEQRYASPDPQIQDSVEVYPCLAKHIFRAPDLIVTCSQDYTIRTFDCSNNFSQCQIFEGHFGMVNEVRPYRGIYLLSCSDDCTLRIWKRSHRDEAKEEYGELVTTFYINQYPMKTIAPLPGQRCVCGGLDQIFRVVSLVSGHTLMRLTDHKDNGPDDNFMQSEGCGSLFCLLHIKENIVVSGSDDSTIRFWDVDKGSAIGTYVGHKGYGEDIGEKGKQYKLSRQMAAVWKVIHVGDDGNSIASCSYDRTITIWDVRDVADVKIVTTWKAAENAVIHIAMVGPGMIASCGADKEMKIWSITGQLLHQVRTERGLPACVQYLDEHLLAMCGGDSSIRIIDWKNTPEDKMGTNGFNAHEYIISDVAPIYYCDEAEGLWTQRPIMYCTTTKEAGEVDAQSCIDMHRKTLQEALAFEENL